MSRTLNTAITNALSSEHKRPVLLVRLDFSSGALYLNTSAINIIWAGATYLGVGGVADVSALKESGESGSMNIQLTMSGLQNDIINTAMTENYQGRDVDIYFGVLTENHNLASDAVTVWAGKMDVMNIEVGQTSTVTISAESELTKWSRSSNKKYTHQEQVTSYPGDLGLEFISTMMDLQLDWGKA